MTLALPPRSCASCGIGDCAMNRRHGVHAPPAARTAYVMDDAWPEYASMVAAVRRPDDQLIAPGVFGKAWIARYGWGPPAQHHGALATIRRHMAMRRVARAGGGVRQRVYLEHDRRLAHALAKAIDYRAAHLVVAQAWLPWLDDAGALGGRSFDVVMSRYPMADIHRMLDGVAAEIGATETGGSATIADFRADPDLVARETALLARARRIVTLHHGIAASFPGRATLLAWHKPPAGTGTGTGTGTGGKRVAFLGPTITRQRPDLVRSLATGLDSPLILFGAMPAGSDAWDGVAIERRVTGPGRLDGIGAILHPAAFTAQPRALLQASAHGIKIFATPECGLHARDYQSLQDFPA